MALIKKLIIIFSIVTVSVFSMPDVAAASVKTLTLRDAIFLSLRYNPSIRNAELGRVVQKFSLRVAQNAFELQYALTGSTNNTRTISNGVRSGTQSYGLNPGVSLNTPIGTNINLAMSNNSDGQYYNPGLALTITQPLLRGSSQNVVLAPLRNAYDQEIANRIALKSGIINTIVSVITDYRSVISSELSLTIDQQALQRANKNYTDTEKFITAGQKPQMDLAQSKLSVTESQIAILNDENTLATAKQTLLLNLGLNPLMPIKIPVIIHVPPFKLPHRKQSIAIALKNDPTYQTDLLQLKQDRRSLLVAQDNNRWQLNAIATATTGNGTGGKPFNNFTGMVNGLNQSQSFALQLNAPINNLNNQAAIVDAHIALRQQEVNTDLQKDTVITNVLNGIRTLKTDKLSLQEAIEAESLQVLNLQNAYKQFRAGQLDSLSVSQQQTNLTAAQQTVLNSKITLLNEITSFEQLLQQTLKIWHIKIQY